jgi:hypothetical protein
MDKCETCKYYDESDCRRNPPVVFVINGQATSLNPPVFDDFGCGQHKPKEHIRADAKTCGNCDWHDGSLCFAKNVITDECQQSGDLIHWVPKN